MVKQKNPIAAQANLIFLITILTTLVGSIIFQPIIGMGSNLWINEFVWILFPVLLMAKLKGWSLEGVYHFQSTTRKNKSISIMAGISIWFFAVYISMITHFLLDSKIGTINMDIINADTSVYQMILLIIGMVILAPICEEIFFRGFVQNAYEASSKRYGFVFAALLFGSMHILNGLSEVIPACIIGLVLGYLVYRTGSIVNSMLAHAASNISSILFGGLLGFYANSIPYWLHFLGFGALGITILVLTRLKGTDQEEVVEEDQTGRKKSIISIVSLSSIGLFMIVIGTMEFLKRMGKI